MIKRTTIGRAAAFALAASALAMTAGYANAALLDAPVPSDATITFAGLQWAWGGACPYTDGCYAAGDLSYQGPLGWSLPTAAELALVDAYDAVDPSAFADLFFHAGGNVPAGGIDPVSGAYFAQSFEGGACASPYFDIAAPWCDDGDGIQGNWSGSVIAAETGGQGVAEQLYVRGAVVTEPATWALMLVGFAGLGSVVRRRRATLAA